MATKRKRGRPKKGSVGAPLTPLQRKQVTKLIDKQVDIGYNDVVLDDTDVTWQSTPTDLTSIAEGDSDTTRDGQQIQLLSLQYRINTRPGASQTVTTTCRFIIFRWMKDTAPSYNSILTLGGGIDAPISPLNLTTNKGEYQILHDKMFVCAADSASPLYHRQFKLFKKVLGKVTYPATGSTALKGRIYAQIVSDITANGPRILQAYRLRYQK